MPEFPHYPCESAVSTSNDHNFPGRTLICLFLNSTESSLSLELNKMKFSVKTWDKKWFGSQIAKERSVLVSGTSVFGTGLYLKCLGLCMA